MNRRFICYLAFAIYVLSFTSCKKDPPTNINGDYRIPFTGKYICIEEVNQHWEIGNISNVFYLNDTENVLIDNSKTNSIFISGRSSMSLVLTPIFTFQDDPNNSGSQGISGYFKGDSLYLEVTQFGGGYEYYYHIRGKKQF